MTDTVAVKGFSWCREEPKSVGLANVTRKILCTRHNSNLSPVDEGAISACNVIRECVRLQSAREGLRNKLWTIVRLQIDGRTLERWFLKTLINVTLSGNGRIGSKSTASGEPSTDLVEIAFGLRKFAPNAGLYNAVEIGERLTFEDRFTIVPFFDVKNEYVMGGTFYFQGFRFMLYLGEEGLTNTFSFVEKDGRITKHPRPLYHLKRMNFTIRPSEKRVSHLIDFDW